MVTFDTPTNAASMAQARAFNVQSFFSKLNCMLQNSMNFLNSAKIFLWAVCRLLAGAESADAGAGGLCCGLLVPVGAAARRPHVGLAGPAHPFWFRRLAGAPRRAGGAYPRGHSVKVCAIQPFRLVAGRVWPQTDHVALPPLLHAAQSPTGAALQLLLRAKLCCGRRPPPRRSPALSRPS